MHSQFIENKIGCPQEPERNTRNTVTAMNISLMTRVNNNVYDNLDINQVI